MKKTHKKKLEFSKAEDSDYPCDDCGQPIPFGKGDAWFCNCGSVVHKVKCRERHLTKNPLHKEYNPSPNEG